MSWKKIKFEDYRHCSEATHFENKKNQIEKKVDVDSFRENEKEFIKSNKSVLKSQQR